MTDKPNANMKFSPAGAHLLANEEGKKLYVYDDKTGKAWNYKGPNIGCPTVGIGHLIPRDSTGKLLEYFEDGITAEQAERLFIRDLKRFTDAVALFTTQPLNQNQFDACVSLCYNIGVGNWSRSSVLKCINAKQYDAAANMFLLWKYDSHKEPVLLPRRKRERQQFLKPI